MGFRKSYTRTVKTKVTGRTKVVKVKSVSTVHKRVKNKK